MRPRTRTRALAVLAACTLAARNAPAQDPDRLVEGQLGERIAAFATGAGALGFSGAVLVARRDEVLAALGVGAADLDGRIANTANTLFEIASLTKQFTATALLVLQKQRRLRLDDPIAAHLPGVPDDCRHITIRHLLQHTSGIPGSNSRGGGDDLAAVLPLFLAGGPRHEPGTHWEYWNQGYALAAAIVERAAREDFAGFCARQLFRRAGLRTACFTGDDAPRGVAVAVGVSPNGPPRTALEHPYGSYGFQYKGMGGAVCSAWDLWHWHRALQGTRVLDAAGRKELFAPGPGDYALGWFVRTMEGRKVQSHGGSVRGFLCELRRYPEQDAFLVVLCNRTEGPFGRVVQGVERILFGARIEVPAPLPAAAGRELCGEWVAEVVRLRFAERGGTIAAELLWAVSADRGPVTAGVLVGRDLGDGGAPGFFDWSETVPLRVERDGEGRPVAVQFHGQRFRRG